MKNSGYTIGNRTRDL